MPRSSSSDTVRPRVPERTPSPTRSRTSYSGYAESPDKLYSLFKVLTSLESALKTNRTFGKCKFFADCGYLFFVSILLGALGEGIFNRLLSCSSVDAAGHRLMEFLIYDWMIF